MPDWLSHVVIGLIIAEIFNVEKKSLVVIGSILPDIMPKVLLLGLFFSLPEINHNILGAFHTPFIILLVILLIAPLFKYSYLKVILWVGIGSLFHFLSDGLLKHYAEGGIAFLYPFSYKHYSLELIWSDEAYLILIPSLIVYLAIIIVKNHRKIYKYLDKKVFKTK